MILAIDQGTTGTTVVVYNTLGELLGKAYNEFKQIFPQPSWVEHDPMEIWQGTLKTVRQALSSAGLSYHDLTAIGITNQRETSVLWDKQTGKPVHNAIVWQCRRSTELCKEIKQQNKQDWIQNKTGLVVDAYFSATKIQWLLNSYPEFKQQAKAGKLVFGTIDSWLIWNLTAGQSHLTDHTNASRTMLYNIEEHNWDQELLDYFDIPKEILPKIKNSSDNFGNTHSTIFSGAEIPITGVAGDQQAALFGQGCTQAGEVKNTYGTGCFMLMHTGNKKTISKRGLLTTIACDSAGKPAYALEGSVFIAGAAVQWLRDQLQIIEHAADTEQIANNLSDTQGVYFVPAFTGLGVPHWDMDARGEITGLTRGSGKNEIIRATLESIAYQTNDVLQIMQQDSNVKFTAMKVDGGACSNTFLMQFQADILNIKLTRPANIESTSLGAILLAGIGANIWQQTNLPQKLQKTDRQFTPLMTNEHRDILIKGWNKAVAKVKA